MSDLARSFSVASGEGPKARTDPSLLWSAAKKQAALPGEGRGSRGIREVIGVSER